MKITTEKGKKAMQSIANQEKNNYITLFNIYDNKKNCVAFKF